MLVYLVKINRLRDCLTMIDHHMYFSWRKFFCYLFCCNSTLDDAAAHYFYTVHLMVMKVNMHRYLSVENIYKSNKFEFNLHILAWRIFSCY